MPLKEFGLINLERDWASALSNQKIVGYSHHIHATIVPIGITLLAGWYCSSQSSQLDKI